MITLKVAYAEKDQAKALGARWNKERKVWYVPDGVDSEPFKRWIVKGANEAGTGTGASGAPAGRVDSYVGKQVVGARYVALEHACNPFEPCAQCAPTLAANGWSAARAEVLRMVAGLKAG